jgi:hypothetical protein
MAATAWVVGYTGYEVKIGYSKTRGRGKGAPERRYGTDGIFQLKVTHAANSRYFQKGLPFQAKKRWTKKDSKLGRRLRIEIRLRQRD